jgi:hypothetical protein
MSEETTPASDETLAEIDKDCLVPPAIPKTELRNLVFKQSEHEVREITDYIEWQCNKRKDDGAAEGSEEEELVQHAEKIVSERVLGRDYDVWDVHTNLNRWWVITNPTNLYSQTLMPSLDYTLSFHIGLMMRVMAKRGPDGDDAEQELLLITNRKLVQAGEKFDAADEIEDFQAVGMLCREALTSFVREILDTGAFDDLEDKPKAGDFVNWSDRMVGHVAAGGSAEHVRGYLKTSSAKAWQLVNWLTHAKNATRADAELALDATQHVVDNLTALALRAISAAPEQCGRCKSHKITVTFRPDHGENGEYVAQCDACGAEWVRIADDEEVQTDPELQTQDGPGERA